MQTSNETAFPQPELKSVSTLEASCESLSSPTETSTSPKIAKAEIRASLRASTLDGIFATLFSSITGGVLISNFLIELNATPLQIGLLASMPMVANLLQPLGAYLADRTQSRRRYSLWIYSISRLLWLPLAIVILACSGNRNALQPMIVATLAAMLITHIMDAIGSASWLSWLATLVPRQLRGRYFGLRNSAFSLTGLLALPLLGVMVSRWPGGSIQGFGVMVIVAVAAGLISLGFQSRMADVNPQVILAGPASSKAKQAEAENGQAENGEVKRGEAENGAIADFSLAPDLQATRTVNAEVNSEIHPEINSATQKDKTAEHLVESTHSQKGHSFQYGLFLIYFGLWAFGINLSGPFFNLYLLDNLSLDLSWVTLWNGLGAGANLLMLLRWGRLADRIGNRSILLLDGLLVALTPLLWLGTNAGALSIWLWFPLLHLLGGGTGAAIDLCINNLQFAIVPVQHQTKYFATTAAIGGVAGAAGAIAGGWLAEPMEAGNITELFALSSGLRLMALLPLFWIQEPQRRSLRETVQRGWMQFRRKGEAKGDRSLELSETSTTH